MEEVRPQSLSNEDQLNLLYSNPSCYKNTIPIIHKDRPITSYFELYAYIKGNCTRKEERNERLKAYISKIMDEKLRQRATVKLIDVFSNNVDEKLCDSIVYMRSSSSEDKEIIVHYSKKYISFVGVCKNKCRKDKYSKR